MIQNTNIYGQPIGEELPNWKNRPYPDEVYLVGRYAIITNLSKSHLQELYSHFTASSTSNWTYLKDEFPKDFNDFEETYLKKMKNPACVYYVVLNKETNSPLGVLSLMRINPANGVI